MTTEADPLGIVSGAPLGFTDALTYPYFQSVFDRKSRRVGLGMTVESDVINYSSPYDPVPLSEREEALLVMAGTGLNGLALADLDPARGMSTLVQWPNLTWPSACSNHGTALFWSNDAGLCGDTAGGGYVSPPGRGSGSRMPHGCTPSSGPR